MKNILFLAFLISSVVTQAQVRMPDPPKQDLSKESDRVLLREITSFPEHIFSWNIKYLTVSESDQLTSLPEKISRLKNLESFMLTGGHKIKDFPKEFSSLNQLKKLALHNMLTEKMSPVIFNLKSLEDLEYYQFSYFDFSQDIGKLKTLKRLALSRGFDIRSLQNVEGKPGRNLPPSIKNLKNLETLSLGRNLMSELPEEIGYLNMVNDIWLSDNVLTTLPNGFSKLQNLKTLNLSNNAFKVFPKELYKISNLKRLDIYKNQISQIPAGIGSMTGLTGLFIDKNKLTNECLTEFYNLENLEVLDIRENKITAFPPGLEKMKKLKVVYIAGNNIPYQEISRAQALLPRTKFVTQEMP
ncbi:leucine-rich repeat domain-containing protein [Chryseobacterium nepalense]|uniref:Leucine-rich repeat domain-containing protein n=2 Tax=Chryseobacterium TaxID=59732 RepID=A0ABY4K7E4_9FLAO|nr:leucine-rich repeat domain-containing protein [Chryseobacterium nepalense]MEC5174335.1 Leucine-rich repeat (LRR) protein [Chryseobacterium nepalense]UPQ76684.1 leucine-rich repeat domain-containing protein [Chryseobacterium nepalense]